MAEAVFPSCFLPDPTTTRLTALTVHPDQHSCTLDLQTTPTSSLCPQCQQPATRVHSRYTRQFADLPLATVAVHIVLQTRRFFCDHHPCPRRIFTERLPTLVAPGRRRTQRLHEHHTTLGFALGGRPGTRFATHAVCPVSRHQLLRDVRALAVPVQPDPTIIGVDDWAIRKGQTYGTIILDLRSHQPLDLLADRSAATLARWLTDHPSVTHISRDRAQAYIDGCTQGAPDAIQIADRWHLFQNMRDALVAVLEHYDAVIRQPRPLSESPQSPADPPPAPATAGIPESLSRRDTLLLQRLGRHQRFATIHALRTRGWTHQAIAAHLGIHPKIVSRQLRQPSDGAPTPSLRGSILDPYRPYLQKRWAAGCTNASQLFRELVDQGFTGKASIVRAWVATLRRPEVVSTATTPVLPSMLPAPTPWTPPPVSSTPTQRQVQRHERHTTIQALHALGWEQQAIAAHLGVHPKTVSRQLRRFPDVVEERALRPSVLDPYLPYLLQRWEEGCTNASRLFREVVAQGFSGKASIVREVVAALRKRTGKHARRVATVARHGAEIPTRSTLAAWILRPPSALTPEQQIVLQQVADRSPDLAMTITLSQVFAAMIRNRQATEFDAWLAQMDACGLAAFERLARGMRQDAAAIRAALTLPWSNGPVEGSINRLKMIKRSMYGRAKLDLLRQRVLLRSSS
jgi:transposase